MATAIANMPTAPAAAFQKLSENEQINKATPQGTSPSESDTPELPSYTMFQISNIVGAASLENVKYETTTLYYMGEMAEAAGNYTNEITANGKEMAKMVGIMNDINITLMALSVIALPLVVIAPEVTAGSGAAEATVQAVTQAINATVSVVTAAAGASLGVVQTTSAFAKKGMDVVQGDASNVSQRTKQMSSALSQNIQTQNEMFGDLAELIANDKNSANAYKESKN